VGVRVGVGIGVGVWVGVAVADADSGLKIGIGFAIDEVCFAARTAVLIAVFPIGMCSGCCALNCELS